MPTATVKRCRGCGEAFDPWCTWDHPGAAGARCHPCYLDYTRRRQSPDAERRPPITHGGKPSGKRWRRLQEQVWAEETHCGLCGELVDQTLHHNEAMARSLDHIHPIALGGAMYERDNVRLAHRRCNSKAGAAITGAERHALLRAAVWLSRSF